jgi:hypothetical protein
VTRALTRLNGAQLYKHHREEDDGEDSVHAAALTTSPASHRFPDGRLWRWLRRSPSPGSRCCCSWS